MFDDYPYGGLCEYMTAPQYSLVKLPHNLSFETAARFGYLGTGYRALRRSGVGPGTTVLINGISGTLGLGCALFALGLGARKVLGTGRNVELLERVKKIAPDRIEVHQLGSEQSTDAWAKGLTDELGVDVVIDALGPGAPQSSMLDAVAALRRGGEQVNIGAVAGAVPIDLHYLMDNDIQLSGSVWFTAGQGQEMADLVEAGVVDLSVFEHRRFPLEDVNRAISGLENRDGGFSNYVICP
ncbi:zinc-binding dehydrogenase [Cupriavidus necator]|nr:zinc-binding dehydrogenase [Cupriavidus necator]MDX6007670.1 zinc-binding dehydrogenase [Cupriavidus necator]